MFVPLYSILMTGHTQAEYEEVFRWVKKDLGKRVSFVAVKSDFEKALRNAVRTVWPKSKVSGCYFHFCQAVYRHMCKVGLQQAYFRNKKFKLWLRHLMALPNLKPVDIEEEWSVLSKSDVAGLSSVEKIFFMKFKKYFNSFWILQTGASNFSSWGEDDRFVIC